MHMSLPAKFPPPVTAKRTPINRLRNIITIAAGTFFILVFFLAIKFYLPNTSGFIATKDSPTAAVVPEPPQKNFEPITEEDKSTVPPVFSIFSPPTPEIERPCIRDGDNILITGVENGTKWHSVGRPPGRKDCWSYTSRFKPYTSPSQEVLDLISNNNKPTNNRALIVRLAVGHPWKKEFNLHARSVVLEAGAANYDVIFLVHSDLKLAERRKWMKEHVPREFRNLTKTFSTKDVKNWLKSIGPAPFKNIMEHNHLALQMFVTKNTQYDFIYSIESDVRLIGRWDEFLNDIDEEYKSHRERQGSDQDMPETPDLVTFEAQKRPGENWLWFDDKCLEDFGGREDLRTSIGPMWGWSRRLIEKLNEYNANGVNCYYEYFAPTIAYKEALTTFFYQHPLYCSNKSPSGRHSLKLEELGKNDPRTVQYDKVATGCTYFFVNPHSQPFWDQWYKARDNPDSCWPTALVHPVKGEFYN
ncbi:hypothetical protein TWF718_008789 [Orbilia javanica]|uniref:Uncharacterized protein n=1 Tax=Orbilia javanica TaxID=47235 RepID=A0AAN8MYJ8_9PEZI